MLFFDWLMTVYTFIISTLFFTFHFSFLLRFPVGDKQVAAVHVAGTQTEGQKEHPCEIVKYLSHVLL